MDLAALHSLAVVELIFLFRTGTYNSAGGSWGNGQPGSKYAAAVGASKHCWHELRKAKLIIGNITSLKSMAIIQSIKVL